MQHVRRLVVAIFRQPSWQLRQALTEIVSFVSLHNGRLMSQARTIATQARKNGGRLTRWYTASTKWSKGERRARAPAAGRSFSSRTPPAYAAGALWPGLTGILTDALNDHHGLIGH